MNTEVYRQTRATTPLGQLRQYDGKWVAFSTDGRRIVAAADTLAELDRLVVAAGKDPEAVGFERIDLCGDSTLGGAELH